MSFSKLSSLVYSTETGRLCPVCEQPVAECTCKKNAIPEGDGIVRVSRETKGRKGAGVTLVKGVLATEDDLKQLCSLLKKRCGVGGAVKDFVIEIQGDKRDQVIAELEKQGYKVKRAGG